MSTPSLLGPNGTPYVELGGQRAWRQRVIGDIVVSYQWLDMIAAGDPTAEGHDQPEPCMVMFPAHRRMDTGAYVIPMRNAYHYVTNKGNPTPNLLASSFAAAETLGFDMNDKAASTRMVDIICEGIPDLIDMPSEQPSALEIKRHRLGIEVSAKAAGKTMHSEVL